MNINYMTFVVTGPIALAQLMNIKKYVIVVGFVNFTFLCVCGDF